MREEMRETEGRRGEMEREGERERKRAREGGRGREHLVIHFRYRQGMRGRLKAVILELLQEYYRVEEAFQGESQ